MPTILGLQYLRAVAALSVLLFHAAVGAGGHHALGTGGVDIFFVLSGFLMFYLADADPAPLSFALARIIRIVPAYWLVTLIVAATQMAGLTERSSFDADDVIRSFLFLPSYDEIRHEIYPTLIVGWTLNYEMFFYALMSGALFLPSRARLPLLTIVFSVLIAALAMTAVPSTALRFYGDPVILEFLIGAFVFTAWKRDRLPARGWWLVGVGVLLMLGASTSGMPRFIGYGIPAAAILVGILAEERRKPLPRLRKLKLLGDASYSIYLWHLFVVTAVFRLFGGSPPVFALAVAGGVAVGVLSYFVIERPLMALFRKRAAHAAATT